MKFINNNKYLILILSIVSTIVIISFLPYILTDTAFVYGHDLLTQWRPWFYELSNQVSLGIEEMEIPFWSWNTLYGSNFFGTKSFYFLTDIFQYLSLLLGDISFTYIIMFQITGKIILSAFTFYLYGKTRKWSNFTIVITSLLFALSSYAIKFSDQSQMLYFYSLIPLYFASLELFLNNKNKYLFSIATTILLIANYYLFFALSLFTIIYFLYRYFEINESFNDVLISIRSAIAFYLLGIFCSSFILLPSALDLLDNSRVAAGSSNLIFYENIKTYFHLLISSFIPSNVFIDTLMPIDGYEIYMSPYTTGVYKVDELAMFSSSLVSLLIIQSLFDKNQKIKWLNRMFYFIMALFLFVPLFNSTFHLFSDATFRWTMFIIFMNIVLASKYLENINLINNKILILSSLFILILTLSNAPILIHLLDRRLIEIYPFLKLLTYFMIFIVLYCLILYRKKYLYFIVIVLIIELFSSIYIDFNSYTHYSDYSNEYMYIANNALNDGKDLKDLTDELGSYNEFYRFYVHRGYWELGDNQNLRYDFSDLSMYDSAYNYANNDLLKLTNDISSLQLHDWHWKITEPNIIDFSSVKYAIVESFDELPHNNFILVYQINGMQIYENLNFMSIANTYNNLLSLTDYSKLMDTSILKSTVIAYDHDINEIESSISNNPSISATNIYTNLNQITFDIDSVDGDFVVTSIGYHDGWTVYVNDEKVDYYKVNGGFIGFSVPSGTNNIELKFITPGFYEGALLSFISCLVLIYIIVINKKNKLKESL